MHLFEYALRVFLNVERRSTPGSLIVLDDCLPPSSEAATREFHRGAWTGDVWKVLLYLRDERPDLDVCAFDVSTGLGVVQGLDPARPMPDLAAIIDRYQGLDYSAFIDDLLPSLDVVRGSLEDMRARLPAEPWQQRDDLASAIRSREERSVPFATRLRRAKRGFLRTPPGRAAVAVRRKLSG